MLASCQDPAEFNFEANKIVKVEKPRVVTQKSYYGVNYLAWVPVDCTGYTLTVKNPDGTLEECKIQGNATSYTHNISYAGTYTYYLQAKAASASGGSGASGNPYANVTIAFVSSDVAEFSIEGKVAADGTTAQKLLGQKSAKTEVYKDKDGNAQYKVTISGVKSYLKYNVALVDDATYNNYKNQNKLDTLYNNNWPTGCYEIGSSSYNAAQANDKNNPLLNENFDLVVEKSVSDVLKNFQKETGHIMLYAKAVSNGANIDQSVIDLGEYKKTDITEQVAGTPTLTVSFVDLDKDGKSNDLSIEVARSDANDEVKLFYARCDTTANTKNNKLTEIELVELGKNDSGTASTIFVPKDPVKDLADGDYIFKAVESGKDKEGKDKIESVTFEITTLSEWSYSARGVKLVATSDGTEIKGDNNSVKVYINVSDTEANYVGTTYTVERATIGKDGYGEFGNEKSVSLTKVTESGTTTYVGEFTQEITTVGVYVYRLTVKDASGKILSQKYASVSVGPAVESESVQITTGSNNKILVTSSVGAKYDVYRCEVSGNNVTFANLSTSSYMMSDFASIENFETKYDNDSKTCNVEVSDTGEANKYYAYFACRTDEEGNFVLSSVTVIQK